MTISPGTRIALFFAGAILILCGGSVLKSYVLMKADLERYQHVFVSARWKDPDAQEYRFEMLDDLRDQLRRMKPTRDQVLSFLGGPEAGHYPLAEGMAEGKGYATVDGYIVASQSGDRTHPLMFRMFCIGYDGHGRLMDTWLMNDNTVAGGMP